MAPDSHTDEQSSSSPASQTQQDTEPVEPNLNDPENEAEPRSERADNEVEPTLSDFMGAYVVIEAYENDERLTEAQREILQEAHVVLQNCEAIDDVETVWESASVSDPDDDPEVSANSVSQSETDDSSAGEKDFSPNYGTLGGT